ncbi:cell surface glycoprotein 1-like isoform X2 [Esox lucius]|nr:cell surface glycoprotein 1-like isoform X2 [Esox lucius]
MTVRTLLNVFMTFVIFLHGEKTAAQEYGGRGGEIILTPTISGKLDEILWKHNGNKVVEFDRNNYTEYGSYKGRTVLERLKGELTIKGLTDADSGTYQLEAVINKKLQYSNHEVHVIDAVTQPSVSCTFNDSGTTLLCSADLHPLTQFWKGPGGSETPGSELFIPGSENQESVYTCVVKNPVGNKTAELSLKECHTEEVSSVQVVFWLIPLILILCVLLAVWLWCRKRHLTEVTETPKQGNVRKKVEQYEKMTKNRNDRYSTLPTETELESKDEKDPLLQNSSSNTPPDKEDTQVPLDQSGKELNNSGTQDPKRARGKKEELGSESKSTVGEEENVTGAKTDSSVVHRGEVKIQPIAHKDQPRNTKGELDIQTSFTSGQAQIPTPPQDLGQLHLRQENQPEPNAKLENQPEHTKGDTQSSIQTMKTNQETKSDFQTQEDNQETKSDLQTQEDNQETKSDLQTQEDNLETKSDLQTQEDNQETKSDLQTQEDNQETKSDLQTQEDNQETKSDLQTQEDNQETKSDLQTQEDNLETKSDLQTQEDNQETKSDLQTQEDNQETKSDLQTQEDNQETKSDLQTQEDNQETKSDLQTQEDNQETKSDLQTQEDNQETKSDLQTQEDNQETKSDLQTQEDNQETKSDLQTQEDNQADCEMVHGNEDLSRIHPDSNYHCANENNGDDDENTLKPSSSEPSTTHTNPVKLDPPSNQTDRDTAGSSPPNQTETLQGPPKLNQTETLQDPPKPNQTETPQDPPKLNQTETLQGPPKLNQTETPQAPPKPKRTGTNRRPPIPPKPNQT